MLLEQININQDDYHDAKFKQNIQMLKDYYENHGNFAVPQKYETETGYHLGEWLSRQRAKYRDGKMPEWQKKELQGIIL